MAMPDQSNRNSLPELVGEPLYWNGEGRITDHALARMVKSPTTFAAWTLRSALKELQERRAVTIDSPPHTGMCPHCGAEVEIHDSLTEFHNWGFAQVVCPGSGQNPRNAESDGRPLWSGQPNRRFRG